MATVIKEEKEEETRENKLSSFDHQQ